MFDHRGNYPIHDNKSNVHEISRKKTVARFIYVFSVKFQSHHGFSIRIRINYNLFCNSLNLFLNSKFNENFLIPKENSHNNLTDGNSLKNALTFHAVHPNKLQLIYDRMDLD